MSFKDKHALTQLPEKMAALEREVEAVSAVLADPGFFKTDPAGFNETTRKLGSLTQELVQAEEDWLALEILREDLENS